MVVFQTCCALLQGHVAGLTDIPNKGPATSGYAPAQDVVLCHSTFPAAAEAAGLSRVYSGNNLLDDNIDGLLVGRYAGEYAYNKAFRLWNYREMVQYAQQQQQQRSGDQVLFNSQQAIENAESQELYRTASPGGG